MAKYQTIPVLVDAIQWEIGKEIPDVIKHQGCGYRMCPICGGDPSTSIIYYIQQGREILHLRSGDWIITHKDGHKMLRDNKIFLEAYEPQKISSPSLDAFALWLDLERNKSDIGLWRDVSIWGKENAFEIMLERYLKYLSSI